MPKPINHITEIKAGEFYEDSLSHPCVCIAIEGTEIQGISLVDGTYPRSENIHYTTIRKLSITESWQWRLQGPEDKILSLYHRWWEKKPHFLTNPGKGIENLCFFALYQIEWDERVQQLLGTPIQHEWHQVKANITDQGEQGKADLFFVVSGKIQDGAVQVQAIKNNHEWLIDQLQVSGQKNSESLVLIKDSQFIKP